MSKQSCKSSCAIIMPAYNEALGIAATLQSIVKGMKFGEFEIIVVCNGCSDETAEVARAACPEACVLETPVASKTAALNLGLAAAKATPTVFLDADIKTSAAAVRSLVEALESKDCDLAFGKVQFNTSLCKRRVREFYRAWQLNPYFDGGKVGGFFAVSQSGLQRLGVFPGLTNDDEFVRRTLAENAAFIPAATYMVEPPRTLSSLIRVRSRVYRGNSELSTYSVSLAAHQQKANVVRFVSRLLSNPRAWPGAFVFALVALAAHARNAVRRGNHEHWEQDQTARAAQS